MKWLFFAAGVTLVTAVSGCTTEDEVGTNTERSINDPLPGIAARQRASGEDYVLVFEDNFDGTSMDPSKWFVRRRDVHQKQTLNSASPEMASTRDGSLRMSAKPTPENPAYPYTAAYIDTDGLFAQTYGKIEFRMRGQHAPGLWYAVWARPWSTNAVPEIDVEFLARNTTQVWLVNHWDVPPIPADDRRQYMTVGGMDITQFHTYSILWTREFVEWQIDGKTYMHVEGRGVPHEPMFWIMNSWVGGWAGDVSPSTVFPAEFEVDYFRVYRPKVWLTDPSIRVGNARDRYSVGDTIQVEIADFDADVQVEMWDGSPSQGGRLVRTMTKAPFHFSPRELTKSMHSLTFVAKDGSGTRQAVTSVNATVY